MDLKGRFDSTIKEAKARIEEADIQSKINDIKTKVDEVDIKSKVEETKEKIENIDLQQSFDDIKEKVSEIDVNSAVDSAKEKIETTIEEVKGSDNLIFKNLDSLQQVVNVVNEASLALNDTTRNIKASSIPEVLAGALGAGVGGAISFAALYGAGVTGLSAVGITTGLAAAGAGAGMVAGIFVLAAPVAVLAATGVGVTAHMKSVQLQQEKERLYKEALVKHEAIIKALKEETDANQERLDYLQSLNILLQQAIKDLEKDLNINE